ncbi:unnamed protein product [Staurois parvus]|uniref:Uncharacterized protein n=1 Tax=Staurois parvus TaxID=386267 RepID=A0ABN9E256_9NEOB|nr:unnamed protein product [Staurois parvus]
MAALLEDRNLQNVRRRFEQQAESFLREAEVAEAVHGFWWAQCLWLSVCPLLSIASFIWNGIVGFVIMMPSIRGLYLLQF